MLIADALGPGLEGVLLVVEASCAIASAPRSRHCSASAFRNSPARPAASGCFAEIAGDGERLGVRRERADVPLVRGGLERVEAILGLRLLAAARRDRRR